MSGIDINSFLDLPQLSSLDAIELCEVLWLAKYMKTEKKLYIPRNNDKQRHTSEHKPSKKNPLPTKQKETMSKTEVKEAYSEDINEQNIPLKIDNNVLNNNNIVDIHHKGYFEDSGQLSTYLIDFREKILSRRKNILDEERTVDHFVQTNISLPFFKAQKQKKYELYIFIDKSDSMNIWGEMVDVYCKLLQNSGIFKSTRIIYFNTAKRKTYFYRDKLETKSFSPKEIINYHNNKIIFILTDMLSEAWKQGDALKRFVNLNKNIPLFLVQMLPYRLWRSTLLQKASITILNSTSPYPKSENYQSEVDFLLEKNSDIQSLKLPIIDFNLEYLKKIGKVLKAKENNHIDGALFDSVENLFIENKEEGHLSAKDYIDIFFANASSKARELAISFSSVPLNFPIMRMIQEKVLKENTNLYIAEILNSNLLEQNGEIFEFKTIDGEDIREIFLKLLGREKALEILYENSDYIEKNLHTNFSFKALLAGDIDLDNIDIEGNDKVFASIACKVLKRLGKDYAKRAGCSGKKSGKKLESKISKISVNKPSKSIRAIGVGGGGNNVINHMIQENIHNIDLIVADTDAQVLDSSLAPYKMQLGIDATRGLGAGMVPDKGREAALESFEDIKKMLEGSDIVFISAGLGGGTGTGATPIITKAAKDVGALAVSLVTTPFKFEGSKRIKLAKDGLEKLKKESDSTLVVPNEKLLSIVEKNLGIKESFKMVDDTLARAITAIPNMLLSDGGNDINLDFADVKGIMSLGGLGHIGIGHKKGINSALNAARSALESPLFNNISLDNAKGVLVYFNIHPDLPVMEIGEAMSIIEDSVNEDTPVIFGTNTDFNMDLDEVRITIIATGVEQVSEATIINKVIKQLKDQNWDENNIVLDYKLENNHRVDIVLMQENKPISVIEVKSYINNKNIVKVIEKVELYAKELDVSIGYVSDGKKIYEYNLIKQNYNLVKKYPPIEEFKNKIKDIRPQKYLTQIPIEYYMHYRGFNMQKEYLSHVVKERNFIIINGRSGSGKTALIFKYLREEEKLYDYISYIENTHSFFRNLKDQMSTILEFDISDSIDDIIEKLSLLKGRKILVLDDVDGAILQYEDYLIKLADSDWKIILITRAEYFNFKRIGKEAQRDIYYYTMYPYDYEELSDFFKKSIVSSSYPKTGKVFTILDSLTDKNLLQVGSGLSNDFEIVTLAELHEIFIHNGIKSTQVLAYHEERPNVIDMIMNSEIDLVILQISSNMTKDEIQNIFMIFQTAQQNNIPLIIDNKQLDRFMSDLALVYYECTECNRLDSFTCSELDWETVFGSERNMGPENEHKAIYEDKCKKCNNEIEITLTCWEYPIGVEEIRDTKAIGAKVIEGDCCPNLHNEYNEEPTEDNELGGTENNYNLLVIDTNLMHLDITRNTFENKGFNPAKIFPRRTESENFINDIQVLSNNTNILELRDYIIRAIENFHIHALIIEPLFDKEDINHPNDAIGSKVIVELEKIDIYKELPILVLSDIRKYAMVNDLIVSENILLVEKPYNMNLANMNNVLDKDIMDDLNNNIMQYLEFKTETTSSTVLTLGSIKENLYDEIYQNLLEVVDDEFKDYSLDADYLPEGIDEVTITELSMPEELEFIKLIKNHDTYILNLKFETEASVWMLVDKNHHDYISLKPLPVRDHNKQYYNAESEEILYIELSVEFQIDKNDKIRDLVIDSIDDVVLLEDEHGDAREEKIKEQIFNDLKDTLKELRLGELEYYQIHDLSLPSDDHSAIITSYDTPNTIEIEDIEIFSDQFSAKVYVEQKVYLDIHILKNEYYSNEKYISLYGAVEELNEHYVTVEGEALIRITLNIQGMRTNTKKFKDNFDVEIEDILITEQISMNEDIDSEKYTVCQMLGTSYFIKIILSEKDKKKMSRGYVSIDVRDYGIDGYLRYPNKKSTTSYDRGRFKNILNNTEKKNWEIELNCSGMELQESMGETYLTSRIFEPFETEKEKEDYLNFLAIESEMEAWLSENYIEMEDELTYDAYEGKYQHIRGGTSDLEEVLYSKFKNIYPQEYVARAIKTINQAYGDKDFNQVMYSKEDDATPDISYFTKEYSHKIDEVVKWIFENYEDPISLTSDVLKEILVVEFKEKYSNDFIEKIIESIKLEYGEVNNIDENDKGFLNIVKRNGKIETLDVTKFQNYVANIDDMATREELHKRHKEWLAKKNKNLDILRGKKDKKK